MRTAEITLMGEKRLLCFSTRVVKSCAERYGSVDGIGEALEKGNDADMLGESLWILAQLLDAGYRYAKLQGLTCPAPLSYDDLLDCCDIGDFAGLAGKIRETIASGTAQSVEAEIKNE